MPATSHHVACITDDPGAVDRLLTDVLGLAVHLRFRADGDDMARAAGWPPSGGADVVMYGRPPAGIVEVIAIPDELKGLVEPRIWLVSFATADIDSVVDRARRAGFDPSPPDPSRGEVRLTTSVVDVGGITWELVAFDTP